MRPLNVGVLVMGLGVLFGRNNCEPRPQGSSNYLLSEQSSAKVGKVEVSSSSASSTSTSSNDYVEPATYQQQQYRQPQVISQPQPQQYVSNQFQRLQQSSPYEQAQSQYERQLAQYRQALMAYQQQTAQTQYYQQPQPVQQQQYYQPVQQQPSYYQPYNPYPQYDYYSRPSFEPSRRTSSSSSLFGGLTSGLRSLTNGLGFGILG